MSFFLLCDTFPCWQQKVKQILYFDKKNKNNKYATFTFFFYKLAYIIIIYIYFSLRHIIMLTTKCKTNLILDKTNKINSLQ